MSEQSGSWQPDPFGRHQYRYWDGSQWSDQVSNDGVLSSDPPAAEPAGGGPSEPAPDATTPMAATPAPAPGGPGGPAGPPPGEPQNTGGGGSNLPGILIGVILLLLLIGALVWFLVLAGDDDDDDDLAGVVATSLREELDLTSSQAECVTDELSDSGDLSDIAESIEAGDESSASQQLAIDDAFAACDLESLLDGEDSDEDSDDEGTTDTTEGDDADGDDAEGPDVSFPPAMIRMAAEEMAAETGITVDQAECFLGGMLGSLSEEQFEAMITDPDSIDESDIFGDAESFGEIFELFEECDIDPFELDGGMDEDFDSGGLLPGDTYGDNPVLDEYWDGCEAGDMAACDDLYANSEFGSEYETFGSTCGGRDTDSFGTCSLG